MIEIEVLRATSVAVKFLKVEAEVRYWDDATVNGIEDREGSLIPCRNGNTWSPVIDLETGIIQDWPQNTVANIHYKVCDAGRYVLLDAEYSEAKEIDGYVPSIMAPGGDGYGDYIVMTVGPDGAIANFDGEDLDEFKAVSS